MHLLLRLDIVNSHLLRLFTIFSECSQSFNEINFFTFFKLLQKFKSRKNCLPVGHWHTLPSSLNTASIDRRSTPLFWYKQRHPLPPFNLSPSLPLYLWSFSVPFSAHLPPRLHSERLSDDKC